MLLQTGDLGSLTIDVSCQEKQGSPQGSFCHFKNRGLVSSEVSALKSRYAFLPTTREGLKFNTKKDGITGCSLAEDSCCSGRLEGKTV